MELSIFGLPTKRRNFVAKTVSYGSVLCTRGGGSVFAVVCLLKGRVTPTSDATAVRSVENDVSIFGVLAKHHNFIAKTSQRESEASEPFEHPPVWGNHVAFLIRF